MRYYPVFLDIRGKPCAVIGGGSVAERKVRSLVNAGASVSVIAPEVTSGIGSLAQKGLVKILKKPFKAGDLKGFFLVVSAAGSREANQKVCKDAQEFRVLKNIVDEPQACDFIVPSVVQRRDLSIAISTAGRFPKLSKKIRLELEKAYGGEYGVFLKILGAIRDALLKDAAKYGKKEKIFNELLCSPIMGWLRHKQYERIDAFLKESLGIGYTLKNLGLTINRPRKNHGLPNKG